MVTLLQADVHPTPPGKEPIARRLRDAVNSRMILLVVGAVVVGYLTLVPLATMLYASFQSDFLGPTSKWTFSNFVEALSSPKFVEILGTSVLYAGAVAIVCVVLGFGLAWLYVRSDAPAKKFALFASLVPLIIPGILNTVAWGLLLSPGNGPINVVLQAIGLPEFNLYSMTGMVFVQATHVTPIAFLMGVASLSSMDSSLEEAAAASGAGPLTVFRTVTFPLMRPAFLGALFLMFVQTMSSFEVPQLIGVAAHKTVFSTEIYRILHGFPPDYGQVSVLGVVVLVMAIVGLWASRKLGGNTASETITGKGYRPALTKLGRWRWPAMAGILVFFIVSTALPLLILLWASLLSSYRPMELDALREISLDNYAELLTSDSILHSFSNSLIVALVAGLVVTAICSIVAYIAIRTRIPGRGFLEALTTVPLAVPSIILGVAILFWYLVAPLPFRIYGTLAILIIAMITNALPYGMRYLIPGVGQIKNELEEASSASGAPWIVTFVKIYLPLLVPALTASFLYTFIVSFRELSSAIFLYTQNTQVISISVFELWGDGNFTLVSALGVIMVLVAALIIGLINLISRKFGVKSA